MQKKLTIGSRSSDLALWQTHHIQKELEKSNKNISISIKLIKTKGDKILDVALSKIGDKGLFTKELENELLEGTIDIAVHSLKDLETQLPKGLKLAAVTKRHPAEDVLIARKPGITVDTLPENAIIATGSLRRKAQLQHIRPDITVYDLRGNVPTRIQKFLDSHWDGIILARAGVERLNLEKHISSFIPVAQILPAVGQGALGIEIKNNNQFAQDILQAVHDENTYLAVMAERSLMRTLKGGCQVPVGAFAEIKSDELTLKAIVASLDGKVVIRKGKRGNKNEPEKIGDELARELLTDGANDILEDIYRSND